MPRSRQRITLESGLKLDLNKLRRQGLIRPGTKCGVIIRWTNTYTGEEIAQGIITSNIYEGWLRIQLGSLDQTITLIPKPCHFGGCQWYFVCPAMNRYASVLWMPTGANRFCSRQAWGRRVAYASQFLDPDNRAHRGLAKIKSRLIADLDPDEWNLPPKPKGMHWRTYNRYVERYDAYEEILTDGIPDTSRQVEHKIISFEINRHIAFSQKISIPTRSPNLWTSIYGRGGPNPFSLSPGPAGQFSFHKLVFFF